MSSFRLRLATGLVLTAAAAPCPAAAQGYGVYEQGACAMGRAGAAVAAPCTDGSAIFFNPAGIASAERQQLGVGGTLIAPGGSFHNDLTGFSTPLKDAAYPVPNLYYTRPLGGGRAALGLGLFAPYGLTTEWPDDFEGRFLGYKSHIAAVYLQPTLATHLLPLVSIGAGLDVSFVSVQLRQRLELSSQVAAPPSITFGNLGIPYGTEFADVNLHGSGNGVGYHVGMQVGPIGGVTVGARYLARQLVTIRGATAEISQILTGIVLPANNPVSASMGSTAPLPIDLLLSPQFAAGGPLSGQSGATYLRFPEQLVLGLAWQPVARARVLFDFQYTNWSVFDRLQLEFERLGQHVLREGYGKSYGYRFGGEYELSRSATLRAGFYTHGAAAPPETVTPNLPEGPRNSVTAGLGLGLMRNLRVDLAYQYIAQADRRGRTIDGGAADPTASLNNGLYTFHAHLVGASLALAF